MHTDHQLADPIARVQRIARYAAPGCDVGIPWDLFESYIEALERTQTVQCTTAEIRSSRNLAVPVSLNTSVVRYAGDTGTVWFYPVIK